MAGSSFKQRYWKALTWPQIKVLNAIVRCRTWALGGHRDRCDHCGYQHLRFHSCRNRHCPKCQTNAREKWLRRRQQELPRPRWEATEAAGVYGAATALEHCARTNRVVAEVLTLIDSAKDISSISK
jgi:hypothetical protein